MRIAFLAALLCALASPAHAEEPDCYLIRAKVKEHGKVIAYAWAVAQGYTPKDIARIRKLCGV